ncbi:MAG: J domain-containing protein [Deltaproteobacteria bacterium]|nr:J domain-containing protein [Deltaproteobacteria bacterium]
MPQGEARSIRVKCVSWEQVEALYQRKLKGDLLLIRMPIRPALGDLVSVTLDLPSGLLFTLGGQVTRLGAADKDGKYAVVLQLSRPGDEVRDRLSRLVTEAAEENPVVAVRPPIPEAEQRPASASQSVADRAATESVRPVPVFKIEDVLPAERSVYLSLEQAKRQLLGLKTHEVLGIASDADLSAVRGAYFALAKTYHPDIFGRYRSKAVRAIAAEVFLHVNRAYDRLRDAALARGEERVPGPSAHGKWGWLVLPADDRAAEDADVIELQAEDPNVELMGDLVPGATAGGPGAGERENPVGGVLHAPAPLTEEDLFDDVSFSEGDRDSGGSYRPAGVSVKDSLADQGQRAIAAERWEEARELIAAALKEEPRNRTLRALYHVASGQELRARGRAAEATLHFETALAHDSECVEARRALGREPEKKGILRRFFDRQA